jgi:hypothetical protein
LIIIMEELYQVRIMISKEVIIAISNLVTLAVNLVTLALPKIAKLVATIANLVTMLSRLKYLAGTGRKTRKIRKQKIITIRKYLVRPQPLPGNVKVVPVLAARKKTGNQHPP